MGTLMGTQKKMPDWLRRAIENQNPTAFQKFAWWEICNLCGAVVLVGWDAYDDYAGKYKLDPAALDTMQELAAAMAGRLTFELRHDADGRKTISRRDDYRIAARRPENHEWPVLPEHRCRQHIGRQLDRSKLSGKQNAHTAQKN